MRLRKSIAGFLVYVLAAAFTYGVAAFGANIVEDRTEADVARALDLNGFDWVAVQADGLQVLLSGEAPDEATRFRAIRETGRLVDAARIIDLMDIHVPAPIRPPRFSVEILRNDDGISLIGLVPAVPGKSDIVARVASIAGAAQLVELLDEASFEPPELWEMSLEYGISALANLPRSKISIGAGQVEIVASSESEQEKLQLETWLRAAAPQNLSVAIDIAAPRPVITPFTLRFLIDGREVRFDACSTDTEIGAAMILAAARSAGLSGQARCTIGLGVPSPDWDEAVIMGVTALAELGQGSVTFSDADVTLIGTPGMDPERFDRVTATLKADLPDVFSLFSILPEPEPEPGELAEAPPPEFAASLSPEGLVQLRGPIADERSRVAAQSFARALFGSAAVTDALRPREAMPPGWSMRVFAGLEALAELKNGLVRVRTDLVQITGDTGNQNAQAEVARILSERLGGSGEFEIDITYQEELDPLASIPSPRVCVDQINLAMAAQKITFAPSSADIDDDGRATIAELVEIMKECEHVEMEVAGHTDSQGREIMNKELSQARAYAVVNALQARRVLTSNLDPVGYGEELPIADNETEEGREANRRIEFLLVADKPDQGEDAALIDAAPEQPPAGPGTDGPAPPEDAAAPPATDATANQTATEEPDE